MKSNEIHGKILCELQRKTFALPFDGNSFRGWSHGETMDLE